MWKNSSKSFDKIKGRTMSEIRTQLNEYNWDDGFKVPQEILDNPDCDLALALEVFYLADGYAYLENKESMVELKEWNQFISRLYKDIMEHKYQKTDAVFEIPLSKVQKYKLANKQVPEIFLKDL